MAGCRGGRRTTCGSATSPPAILILQRPLRAAEHAGLQLPRDPPGLHRHGADDRSARHRSRTSSTRRTPSTCRRPRRKGAELVFEHVELPARRPLGGPGATSSFARRAGHDHRPGRALRRRQDHHRAPGPAAARSPGRAGADRRRRPAPGQAGRAAPGRRPGAAGRGPVQRHPLRQHRLRPARTPARPRSAPRPRPPSSARSSTACPTACRPWSASGA